MKRSRWCVKIIGILLLTVGIASATVGTGKKSKVNTKRNIREDEHHAIITEEGGALIGYYHWEDKTGTSESDVGWVTTSATFGSNNDADEDTVRGKTSNDLNITFFGTEYKLKKSYMYGSTNGWLSFIATGDPAYNADMPNENLPNATIAPFWTDLELESGEAVKWSDQSGSGYAAWHWYAHTYGTSDKYEFEVKLVDDSDGDTIYLIYKKLTSNAGQYATPSNKEIGIENPDGDVSVEVDASNIDNALNSYNFYRIAFYYQSSALVDFNSSTAPSGWGEVNISGDADWTFGETPSTALEDKAAKFSSGSATAGSERRLVTPTLNLKDATNPAAFFWFYHSSNKPNAADSLIVEVSIDGGASWIATLLKLARYSPQPGWKKYVLDLSPYKGYPNVKLSFKGKAAGGGEDMYIDYFKAFTDYTDDIDVTTYFWPEHVLTGNDDTVKVRVMNRGFGDQTVTVSCQYKTYDGSTWSAWNTVGSLSPTVSANTAQDLAFTLDSDGWSDVQACSLKVTVTNTDDQGGSYGNEMVWYVPVDDWDRWDDGSAESSTTEQRTAVRFYNAQANSFSRVKIYISGNAGTITQFDTVYVVGDASGDPNMSDVKAYVTDVDIPSSLPGWLTINLGTVVSVDANNTVWVVVVQKPSSAIKIGVDKTRPNYNSKYYSAKSKGWTEVTDGDYMIRLGKALSCDFIVTDITVDRYVDEHIISGNDKYIMPKVTIKNIGTSACTFGEDAGDVIKFVYSKNGGDWSSTEYTLDPSSSTTINSGATETFVYSSSDGYDVSGDNDDDWYILKVWVTDEDDGNHANDTTVFSQDTIYHQRIHSGEDAAGWRWEDQIGDIDNTFQATWGIWRDIGNNCITFPDNDEGTVKRPLPFLVKFYGYEYDSVYIGVNGAIDFRNDNIPDGNEDFSTFEGPNRAMVAPFWDDLVDDNIDAAVCTLTVRGTGADTFFVEWRNMDLASTANDEDLTFQLMMINRSNTGYVDFVFKYASDFPYNLSDADATIGLYSYRDANKYYAQFSYDDDPLSVSDNADYVWLTVPTVIYWRNPQTTLVEESNEPSLPTRFALFEARPNPVNGLTEIKFALPKDADVEIVLYDARGRVVRELAKGHYNAGYHSVAWDGRDASGNALPAGVYFYRMNVRGEYSKTQKLLVVR